MTGTGAQLRRVGQDIPQALDQFGIEAGRPESRTLLRIGAVGGIGHCRDRAATVRRTRPRRRHGRRATRSWHLGTALTAPGRTSIRPTVATQPSASAAPRTASVVSANEIIASRRSAIAVVPAWFASPGKSSRQRPCGQMSVPIADRLAEVDQAATLFDMQLDEAVDPAQCVWVRADRVRTPAGGSQRLRHREAALVDQAEARSAGQRAGDHARACAGDAEAGTLLVCRS